MKCLFFKKNSQPRCGLALSCGAQVLLCFVAEGTTILLVWHCLYATLSHVRKMKYGLLKLQIFTPLKIILKCRYTGAFIIFNVCLEIPQTH